MKKRCQWFVLNESSKSFDGLYQACGKPAIAVTGDERFVCSTHQDAWDRLHPADKAKVLEAEKSEDAGQTSLW